MKHAPSVSFHKFGVHSADSIRLVTGRRNCELASRSRRVSFAQSCRRCSDVFARCCLARHCEYPPDSQVLSERGGLHTATRGQRLSSLTLWAARIITSRWAGWRSSMKAAPHGESLSSLPNSRLCIWPCLGLPVLPSHMRWARQPCGQQTLSRRQTRRTCCVLAPVLTIR